MNILIKGEKKGFQQSNFWRVLLETRLLLLDLNREKRNCKVEFYQPSFWLYFVPNLVVIQQLVTLYLGGILVRVVSEIVWRIAQECARKIETRDWILRVTSGCKPPETAHVLGMPEVETSRQLEHYRTK